MENEESDSFDFDLANSDYGFILTNDGQIKALIMPTEGGPVPKAVRQIFKVLKLGDPTEFNASTLH